MPSCSNVCASAVPTSNNNAAPGTGFILKGGDTWVASDLDAYWIWIGTSGSPIYIGVDPNWYSGSSWTRPVWTCGGGPCTYTGNGNGFYTDWSGVQYVTVDNIEVTGLYSSSASYPNYFSIYGSYNTFEHIYAHGWSHASSASGAYDNSNVFSPSTCCAGGLGNIFHDNVIDGSDTTEDSMAAFFSAPAIVYNNVVRYVTNGLEGASNDVHDNWFGPIVFCFPSSGCHQNAIQQAGPVSGTNVTIYDNVITGVASGGMGKLWVEQAAVNNGAINTYVFNNIEFNSPPGNDVDICQLGTNCGTHYFFNNTFECGNDTSTDTCSSPGGGGPTTVVYWTNNHCITSSVCFNNLGTNVTATLTTNLTQSVSTASGQGYTSTSTYAFQTTGGSGSTVGAGTNEQSLCSTIAAFDSTAGTACQSDTAYACAYNTSNHTVTCPDRTVNARPASAAWDIGAYQFGSATPVSPPSSVTAAPH
jgi:hypothetical protein